MLLVTRLNVRATSSKYHPTETMSTVSGWLSSLSANATYPRTSKGSSMLG
jgi:hypothetical protein